MDGVLIDSEPLWHIAEKRAFKTVGIELTTEMCLETTGLRVDELVGHWYARMPWHDYAAGELENAVTENVVELVKERGDAKAGVRQSLEYFREAGLRIALASSSPYLIIEAATEKLGIRDDFEFIYSAQDEEYGKPHPAVYLTTARKLGVSPVRCLAIEDSLNGVIAAKAARMACICVPEPDLFQDPKFSIANLIIPSLEDI